MAGHRQERPADAIHDRALLTGHGTGNTSAALLAELRGDEQTVAETDIVKLEAEIDRAVYDLFDLTEEEREVAEDYLEVF